MKSLRIVLANGSMADYPQGGGHWTCPLQHLFGLAALGHNVFWMELMWSTNQPARDRRLVDVFFRRFQRYGFGGRCALLLFKKKDEALKIESAEIYGKSHEQVRQLAREADLLWNFCCTLRQPLLGLFRHRVLIDLDPGVLQVSALQWDLGIQDHQTFFTTGVKLHDPDCEVPRLGLHWRPFLPVVHLPDWPVVPDPGSQAPFSTVTQWNWSEVWLESRVLSTSKRDAYLRYLELPRRVARPLELAVNLDHDGDRASLHAAGWRLVHPHRVARTPAGYRQYIQRSRAEFACPKPIYRELKTGWFSDRSACYLASGRPVLAEDTGFSDHLPTGKGLMAFHDMDEAVAGIDRIDADYESHSRAARAFAEEFLDARKVLPAMLEACG